MRKNYRASFHAAYFLLQQTNAFLVLYFIMIAKKLNIENPGSSNCRCPNSRPDYFYKKL